MRKTSVAVLGICAALFVTSAARAENCRNAINTSSDMYDQMKKMPEFDPDIVGKLYGSIILRKAGLEPSDMPEFIEVMKFAANYIHEHLNEPKSKLMGQIKKRCNANESIYVDEDDDQ
jgi:hypothetical protein